MLAAREAAVQDALEGARVGGDTPQNMAHIAAQGCTDYTNVLTSVCEGDRLTCNRDGVMDFS